MLAFNSQHMFVGYIKQLLSDFNLPNIRIYKKQQPLINNHLYIKEDDIIKYVDGNEIFIRKFVYNKREINYTRNLNISCTHYDSHTHEYLGEYLRFIRDYNKLNLMSMYNCFSNNTPRNLKVTIKKLDDMGNNVKYIYDNENNAYKIFMLPVKFFEKYTIAINSHVGFDLFCGFYGKSYYDCQDLTKITHKKISNSSFDHPIIWKDLISIFNDNKLDVEELLSLEKDLRLFIVLPISNNSTITILEGDYSDCIDFGQDPKDAYKMIPNYKVINYRKPEIKGKCVVDGEEFTEYTGRDIPVSEEDLNNIKLTNFNQLLFLNSGVSHPFADRLMEYLSGNTITNIDPISDNIKRLEVGLYRNYNDNLIKEKIYNVDISYNEQTKKTEVEKVSEKIVTKSLGVGIKNTPKYKGKWQEKYRMLLYKIAKEKGLLATQFDILGYVDKDIENNVNLEYNIYGEE